MTTKDIIRNTLVRIQKEGRVATPDEYRKVFCQEAKKGGITIDDCAQVERLIRNLDDKLQTQVKNNPAIKDVDTLFLFLSKKLTSNLPQEGAKNSQKEYIHLIKELFTLLKNLKNEEAAFLAKDSLAKAENLKDSQAIAKQSEKIATFSKNLNFDFLKKIDPYLKVNKNDLKEVILSLIEYIQKRMPEDYEKNLQKLFTTLLQPSISEDIKHENEKMLEKVKNEPAKALNDASLFSLENLVDKRIVYDRKEADRRALEIGEIADILSLKILRAIDKNNLHHHGIKAIQDELGVLGGEKISVEELKNRLIKISSTLDSEIEELNNGLKIKQSEIERLKNEIDDLKTDLKSAKKEANEDFLTKVHTKRVLDSELERIEGMYLRHKSDYTIVFFDIDFFKKVNDKYGHDAGDKVLATFGGLLKKNARIEDIIGRYGGEEFLAILPETDLHGAVVFAEHVRQLVEKSKFVYKDLRIELTVSCGVALRSNHLSKEECVKCADERLYFAKNSGRNRVIGSEQKVEERGE